MQKPASPFGKSGLCNQDCRPQARSPTYAGKPGRELVLGTHTSTRANIPIYTYMQKPALPFRERRALQSGLPAAGEIAYVRREAGRELVLLLLGIDLIGVDELVQQLVEGGHVLVDDAVAILGSSREAMSSLMTPLPSLDWAGAPIISSSVSRW